MEVTTKDGKPYYEIETPADALECLSIIREFAVRDAAYNSDYGAAMNGLYQYLKALKKRKPPQR